LLGVALAMVGVLPAMTFAGRQNPQIEWAYREPFDIVRACFPKSRQTPSLKEQQVIL